tara:strand:- start:247 stop:768 length:522 start_codon:yes stop_codon:yes gene_type:complete
MDVDASRSIRQAEVGAMRKMIDRTEERFGIKPDWIAADTAYGSSDNLVWLTLKRQILPFIPVFDNSKRKDGTWSRADFTWDEDNDRYICPEGKDLRHTRRNYSDPARHAAKAGRRQYRSLKLDCQACPSKANVLPKHCDPQHQPREIRNRPRLRTRMHRLGVQSEGAGAAQEN